MLPLDSRLTSGILNFFCVNFFFRAALTSARTTANAIYCPPKLQVSAHFRAKKLTEIEFMLVQIRSWKNLPPPVYCSIILTSSQTSFVLATLDGLQSFHETCYFRCGSNMLAMIQLLSQTTTFTTDEINSRFKVQQKMRNTDILRQNLIQF